MTDNNKCAGSCGTHGSVWVDGYHGQKKVNVSTNTASKVALLSEFNVNLSNCCVPLINGGADEFLSLVAPYSSSDDDFDPQPVNLFIPSFTVTNSGVWDGKADTIGGTDIMGDKANLTVSSLNCCTTLTPTLEDNGSVAGSILKLKVTFKDGTTPVSIINFEFSLDAEIIEGKEYQATFSANSPQFFIHNGCLIQFILPSIIFSGDTSVATADSASVHFTRSEGIQCLSLNRSLQDFISCGKGCKL